MENLNKETTELKKSEIIQMNREKIYPIRIPESQGDLADRADIEIEQEIQELIWRVQKKLYRGY